MVFIDYKDTQGALDEQIILSILVIIKGH